MKRIEAKNLVKIYGSRSVVNGVSFEVNKGEVVYLMLGSMHMEKVQAKSCNVVHGQVGQRAQHRGC